jgi:hypothetical protein
LASVLGILAAAGLLLVGTLTFPGGFNWNRDFISTLLRGPAGDSRYFADAGVLVFCFSVGLIFARLAQAPELAKGKKVVQIAGIGSQIYAAFIITPMHDLMVAVSLLFLIISIVGLVGALVRCHEAGLAALGSACLFVLVCSAISYYGSLFVIVLPWAQRVSFGMLAMWLVALDWRFARSEPIASQSLGA